MLTSNPRCTVCGRTIPTDEWGRFYIEETDNGRHIVVVCALHTDDEVASDWHYDDGNEDYDAVDIADIVDDSARPDG